MLYSSKLDCTTSSVILNESVIITGMENSVGNKSYLQFDKNACTEMEAKELALEFAYDFFLTMVVQLKL